MKHTTDSGISQEFPLLSFTEMSHEMWKVKKKVNQSHYRPEVPRGFQEVKVPRLRDNGPG